MVLRFNAFVGLHRFGSVVLSFLALANAEWRRVEVASGNVDEVPDGVDGRAVTPNGGSGIFSGGAVVFNEGLPLDDTSYNVKFGKAAPECAALLKGKPFFK